MLWFLVPVALFCAFHDVRREEGAKVHTYFYTIHDNRVGFSRSIPRCALLRSLHVTCTVIQHSTFNIQQPDLKEQIFSTPYFVPNPGRSFWFCPWLRGVSSSHSPRFPLMIAVRPKKCCRRSLCVKKGHVRTTTVFCLL